MVFYSTLLVLCFHNFFLTFFDPVWFSFFPGMSIQWFRSASMGFTKSLMQVKSLQVTRRKTHTRTSSSQDWPNTDRFLVPTLMSLINIVLTWGNTRSISNIGNHLSYITMEITSTNYSENLWLLKFHVLNNSTAKISLQDL